MTAFLVLMLVANSATTVVYLLRTAAVRQTLWQASRQDALSHGQNVLLALHRGKGQDQGAKRQDLSTCIGLGGRIALYGRRPVRQDDEGPVCGVEAGT